MKVGHGIAFDMAGEGKASPDSLIDAIIMAADIARNNITKMMNIK